MHPNGPFLTCKTKLQSTCISVDLESRASKLAATLRTARRLAGGLGALLVSPRPHFVPSAQAAGILRSNGGKMGVKWVKMGHIGVKMSREPSCAHGDEVGVAGGVAREFSKNPPFGSRNQQNSTVWFEQPTRLHHLTPKQGTIWFEQPARLHQWTNKAWHWLPPFGCNCIWLQGTTIAT